MADGRALRSADASEARGSLAPPGTYSATLIKRVGDELTQLAAPVEFDLVPIREGALAGSSYADAASYARDVAEALRRSSAASAALSTLDDELKVLRIALDRTPGDVAVLESAYALIRSEMQGLNDELNGLSSRKGMGATPATVSSRLRFASYGTSSAYGPTPQHREQFGYAVEALDAAVARVATLVEETVPAFRNALVEAGAPWTPGSALPR
jgi:hypothetical protein